MTASRDGAAMNMYPGVTRENVSACSGNVIMKNHKSYYPVKKNYVAGETGAKIPNTFHGIGKW